MAFFVQCIKEIVVIPERKIQVKIHKMTVFNISETRYDKKISLQIQNQHPKITYLQLKNLQTRPKKFCFVLQYSDCTDQDFHEPT